MEKIGDLTIIEFGAIERIMNPFGQSEAYCYVKDSKENYYIFYASIGNFGISFNKFPYDTSMGKPNITDLDWCKEWFRKLIYNSDSGVSKKTKVALNKKDYNTFSSLLGYGVLESHKCNHCGKENVEDWWYADGFICSDCFEDLKFRHS